MGYSLGHELVWMSGRVIRAALSLLFESGAEAAIDIQHRAGYERRAGTGEEDDAGGDFFCGAVALQRMLGALGFGERAAVLWIHVGVDFSVVRIPMRLWICI